MTVAAPGVGSHTGPPPELLEVVPVPVPVAAVAVAVVAPFVLVPEVSDEPAPPAEPVVPVPPADVEAFFSPEPHAKVSAAQAIPKTRSRMRGVDARDDVRVHPASKLLPAVTVSARCRP